MIIYGAQWHRVVVLIGNLLLSAALSKKVKSRISAHYVLVLSISVAVGHRDGVVEL